MPKGGARPGAGRKPGGATVKPRETIQLARTEVKRILATAKSPLAVLCELSANEELDASLRIQAASAVLPFIYPRLSASVVADVSKEVSRPTQAALLQKLSAQFARLSAPTEEPPTIDVVAIEAPEVSN
jgi:hypothetical protein